MLNTELGRGRAPHNPEDLSRSLTLCRSSLASVSPGESLCLAYTALRVIIVLLV